MHRSPRSPHTPEDRQRALTAPTTSAEAEWVNIDALSPWDKNPRVNDAAVPAVVASIKRFGWGNPILARRADRVVIAGHTRLKAAQSLGMDKVLVRWMDLDPAQAVALALADNRVGEIAGWDDAGLREVLADLEAQAVDLSGLGWSDEEMTALLGDLEGGAPGETVIPPSSTKEIDPDAYEGGHTCPRCGFEFDDDK
jgi:ParB-like chromosome segregation protein Spo0J